MNANPDPSFPTGATFGATGTATETVIGPVVAGIEQVLPSPNIGVAVNETVGSTDGTATGSFAYSHTHPQVPALGRQITGVSWTSGATTLTAAAGTFQAGDADHFVAGPTGGGIDPQSMITAVAADGSSATISVATTNAQTAVSIGTGQNMTFTDSAFDTGNVFTTNGTTGGHANIGVTGVTSISLNAAIPIPFGGSEGVGTSNCLETGFDASNNPGPAQMGDTAPALPAGTVTPLLAASGGFITQPGTTQAITPPVAGFVSLADAAPVPVDASATIDRNTSNTTTVTLTATDSDPTPVASCAVVGSPSDPRLGVSISNSPTPCVATLTDSGSASVGRSVTFQFSATDTAGNVSATNANVTVTVTPIPALTVTTSSLPNGSVGTPYSATLASSGGTPPVTWAVTTGTLPDGLSLNASMGAITGTPTTSGTSNFTVTATDSDSPAETATADLSITVAPPAANDGSIGVIVNGPVRTAAGDKVITAKVSNTGTTTFNVCDTDTTWSITVNGSPTTGTVASSKAACVSLAPAGKHTFKYVWTYGASEVSPGANVSFTGTVNVAGDPTPADNVATVMVTAK